MMDLSRFQTADGEWLPPDEWPTVTRVATCRTDGCKAENRGHVVTLEENPDGILRAICGRCGNPPELTEVSEESGSQKGNPHE